MKHEVTAAEYKRYNSILILYNIIIAIIAIVCCASLFLGSFWSIKAVVKLDGEFLKNNVTPLKDYNVSDLESYQLDLSFTLNNSTIYKTIGKSAQKTTEIFIDDFLANFIAQTDNILDSLLKLVSKSAITTAAQSINLGDETNLDIDNEGIEELVDMFTSSEIEVSQARQKLLEIMENSINNLSLTPEQREEYMRKSEELTDAFIDSIEEYADENGVINTDALIVDTLFKTMNSNGNINPQDFKDSFSKAIISSIKDSKLNIIINVVFKALSIIWLVITASWALLGVFSFIRIFMKKKGAYLGLAKFWGLSLFTVLVIVPTIIIKAASKYLAQYLGGLGVNLAFSSMTIVSFVGAIVLIVLSFAGYNRLKKRVKKSVIVDYDKA